VKAGRWWLSLAYLFASLLAQGYHDHGGGADEVAPESRGDCDEQRQHIADHDVAGHGTPPETCPSCQLRAEHPFWAIAARPLPGPAVVIPIDFGRPSTLDGSPLRARCRAPPRV